jgi:WD40 repeat protein
MRVISGHLGWVRSVTVEPGNKWFATGAGDRTIKVSHPTSFCQVYIADAN